MYSIDSSKTMATFFEALKFNRLFLELEPVICQTQPVHM
jgi:hypothetical protein